jgi:hypothetical protein
MNPSYLNFKFQILDFTCLPQAGIFQSAIFNLQSAIFLAYLPIPRIKGGAEPLWL